MLIVFDMDNTLADEFGSAPRPGMHGLLQRLLADGHKLALWTNSTGRRAKTILMDLGFRRYFSIFKFREDYDPGNRGKMKDIRQIGGDILIDDDPAEVRYVNSIKKKGILISAYRKGAEPPEDELEDIYKQIKAAGAWRLFR